MPKARGLIVTPRDAAGQRVQDTIRRALRTAGVEPILLDELAASGAQLTDVVIDAIGVSDFVIFDVSRQNPKVIDQLDYAHSLSKPTVVLVSAESASGLPSSLEDLPHVSYDPNNLRGLAEQMQQVARVHAEQTGEGS